MISFFHTIFILSLAVLATLIKADLPAEISKCKPADANCIARTIEKILEKYPKGNKDFGLMPVDKFTIKDVTLGDPNSNGPVQLRFHFKSADVYGIEKATIDRVVGFQEDLDNSKFEVYATVPLMTIKGKYATSGRILLLPLNGEGDAEIKLHNVKVSMKIRGKSDMRNGKRFAVVTKSKVVLKPEVMHVHLDNLFKGNKELGDSMNAVINQNWKDIWTELGAGINQFVENMLADLLKDVLKELAYDDFYKKV